MEITPEFLSENVDFSSTQEMNMFEAELLEIHMEQPIEQIFVAPSSQMRLMRVLFYIQARRQFGDDVTMDMVKEIPLSVIMRIGENTDVSDVDLANFPFLANGGSSA